MLGAPLPTEAKQQAGLPFDKGGCRIRIPSDIQPAARIACIASYLQSGKASVGTPPIANNTTPADLTATLTKLETSLGQGFDPLRDWKRDWARMRVCSPEYTSQQWWSDALASAQHTRLSRSLEGRQAARLASQNGGLSSAWRADQEK